MQPEPYDTIMDDRAVEELQAHGRSLVILREGTVALEPDMDDIETLVKRGLQIRPYNRMIFFVELTDHNRQVLEDAGYSFRYAQA